MSWLTWRQHRAEAAALGALVVALGAVLLLLGLPMYELFPDGLASCAGPTIGAACPDAFTALRQEYGYTASLLTLLNGVPFVIGAFLGAPLLARELESGTWQLAWTQAVPRMRWLVVKLVALGGLVVVLGAAFAAMVAWFHRPLDFIEGSFGSVAFDVVGLVPPAYALFAFAAGAAAGALLRRSLPALGAALAAFVVVRVFVANGLRPGYLTPVTLFEALPDNTRGIQIGTDNRGDWSLDQGIADRGGTQLDGAARDDVGRAAGDAGMDLASYLREHGYQRWVSYQPAERFWTFQLIEAGMFVALSALLLAVVVWRVRRRAFGSS
jgi:hypothetical protein